MAKEKTLIISLGNVYEDVSKDSIFDGRNRFFAKLTDSNPQKNTEKLNSKIIRIVFDHIEKVFSLEDPYKLLDTFDEYTTIKIYAHGSREETDHVASQREIFDTENFNLQFLLSVDQLAGFLAPIISQKTLGNLSNLIQDHRPKIILYTCEAASNNENSPGGSFADKLHDALKVKGILVDLLAFPEKITVEGVDRYHATEKMGILFLWGPQNEKKIVPASQEKFYKPEMLNSVLVCAHELLQKTENYLKQEALYDTEMRGRLEACLSLKDIENFLAGLPCMSRNLYKAYQDVLNLDKDFKNIHFISPERQPVYFILLDLNNADNCPLTLSEIKGLLLHPDINFPGCLKISKFKGFNMQLEWMYRMSEKSYSKFLLEVCLPIEQIESLLNDKQSQSFLIDEKTFELIDEKECWLSPLNKQEGICQNDISFETAVFKGKIDEEKLDLADIGFFENNRNNDRDKDEGISKFKCVVM